MMKTLRSIGRRAWEAHLPARVTGLIAICMLASSIWFLWGTVNRLQEPHSPHYSATHCFDCHEGGLDKDTANLKCWGCHDSRTREVLEGAVRPKTSNGVCVHRLKAGKGTTIKTLRTTTALCLSCHTTVQGYVAMADISTGKYVEVDMAVTHPIGLMPTDTIWPRSLPLSEDTGAINCITCHDPHSTDPRLKMLRYYYPGNGRPADFRPLCIDCHPEGWLPLKLRPRTVKKATRTPKVMQEY